MINRRITRVIFNSEEITKKISDPNSDSVNIPLLTTDYVYIGFYGKFASRHFKVDTPNTIDSVISIEYWNGTTFTPVFDVVDETDGFKKTGFIHWINENDEWKPSKQTPIDDTELYWVRLSVSADLDASTSLLSILNIFSDDIDIDIYYPELISDTRYLPSGKTDFINQHIAAMKQVVNDLKRKKQILDESQVIDITEVNLAAVHKAADIILTPIESSDSEIRIRARNAYKQELSDIIIAVDSDKDGVIEDEERDHFGSISLYRREG